MKGKRWMPNSIQDYRQLIDKPWGRIFYDMIFRQLAWADDVPQRILDFGAGFCVTANHYAEHHHVTAVEPNEQMLALGVHEHPFELIHGDVEALSAFAEDTFDHVICHNVLEYVPDKEMILRELARVLKRGGTLSIVKHHLPGRILANAVFSDDPKAALNLMESGDNESSRFGSRDTYEDTYLIEQVKQWGLSLENLFGIRAFFALSSNNEIKWSQEWYEDMLALEMRACRLDEWKNIAFFHHLIFQKRA